MKVIRQCKCCNSTFKARSADVNRGWALFCSKSCKATNQSRCKKKLKASNDSATRTLKDIEYTYTRHDLIEKLNKNMVYEWDNNILEISLQFSSLSSAYNYILQHS